MRARNMQALTDDIEAVYPGVVIYGKGDEEHQLRTSDHNEDDTAGSRPAQSDADSNPEHRAIDVMVGAAMSLAQCQDLVDNVVADPAARARLRYINFGNRQWHRRNNWEPVDNSDDPHPGHAHFSGDQADDENPASWPAVYRGADMNADREADIWATTNRAYALLTGQDFAWFTIGAEPKTHQHPTEKNPDGSPVMYSRKEPNKVKEQLTRIENAVKAPVIDYSQLAAALIAAGVVTEAGVRSAVRDGFAGGAAAFPADVPPGV